MLRSVGAGGGRPPLATWSRGCDSSGLLTHETIRFWWNRFGPLFAAEIRKKRTDRMRAFSGRRWHLDEVFVKINGERHYLWRAVDQEGEVREAFVSKKRDRKAALKFLRKLMKRYGRPEAIVTDVIIEADSLLRLWLGNGFERSVILVQVLAIGYGVNVMGGAASQTGAGVGRPEFDMKGTVLLTILNPILSLLLVQRFGAAGAAAGTSLSLIIAAAYLVLLFHRDYLGNSASTILRDIHFRPWVAGVLAAVSVWGVHQLLPALAQMGQVRYLTPLKIAADFAIFSSAYVFLLVGLRHITAIDRRNLTGLLSFGMEFVRHPMRERGKIYR